MIEIKNQPFISSNPKILHGEMCFEGTRVPIKTLFEYLETETVEDFLAGFPSVSYEQVISVLKLLKIIFSNFANE